MKSRHSIAGVLLRTVLLLTISLRASGAPGDLDTTFQNKGWKAYDADRNLGFQDIALQPDGRVVVTGSARTGPADSPQGALAVWRFLPDGTPDTSFNGTGRSLVLCDLGHCFGLQVAVRPDGKIVACGGLSDNGGVQRYFVARLLADGRLDTSFGSGGRGWAPGGSEGYGYAYAMTFQSDGSIFLGGSAVVERYTANGLRTGSFGGSGNPLSGNDPGVISLAPQSDDRILCVQRGVLVQGIRRLLASGTAADTSFGVGGTVNFLNHLPGGTIEVTEVAPAPGGKILAAGSFLDAAGNGSIFVARLLSDGSFDPSFGDGSHGPGMALNSFGRNVDTFFQEVAPAVSALRIQPDGKIVAGGVIFDASSSYDIALARFTADGRPDANFGTEGRVRTDLGAGSSELCMGLVFPSERKMLIAGFHLSEDLNAPPGLLARYDIAGSLEVQYPWSVETRVNSGDVLDFGVVSTATALRQIVLRNTGEAILTGLSVSLTNESHPGEFETEIVPLTLAPGATATLGIRLIPSASPGARTATLRLVSDTPGQPPFVLLLTGSKATPQQIWRITWFGSPDNSGPGADLNDFDGDGLVNFMEYATGANPHVFSPAPMTVEAGPGGVSLTYSRTVASLTEFNWQPEAAASLTGPWSSEGLTSEVILTNGNLQTVRVTPAESSARRFFRLRVTRQ